MCKYPKAQFTSTGMAFPCPVLAPISSTVLFWIPLLEIFHLVRYLNRQSAVTGTGRDSFRTISGTGLFQFRYGRCWGPVPELDCMRVVPFPELGYAISGMVIGRVPYRNWTLCVWSHFRYWALPVPAQSLLGSILELGSMCVVPFPVLGYAISCTVFLLILSE